MKRFSDIPSVVHAFAHLTYPECATYNGNVRYSDGVIYSYGNHFPMGRHLGDNIILLTTRSYSQSTGNHKRKLEQAVYHMQRRYCHDPENPLGRDAIFQTMVDISAFLKAGAKRRSPDLAKGDLHHALTMFEEIEWLRDWEKKNRSTVKQWSRWRGWADLPSETKTAWNNLKKVLAAAGDDIKTAVQNMSAAELRAHARRKAAAAKANKAAVQQAKDALAEWQHSGNRIAGFHSIKQWLHEDGLRFVHRSPDDMVGTTQGLYVPADDCRKAWPVIKAAYARLDAGEAQVTFSDRIRTSTRLGSFAPNGIRGDGCLIVGCHVFTRKSVENLAKALGLN